MGNNFKKMMILHKGRYYEIDKKPEFHQAACRHKFIKAQVVKTAGEVARQLAGDLEETGNTELGQALLNLGKQQYMDKIPITNLVASMLGSLPKSVNLCKKCGKVKVRNN